MASIIESLAEVQHLYDAIFCDVWGVVHDGIFANDEACLALKGAVRAGKPVILLTNAPRPAMDVERQITGIGVPEECWNFVVTSGDAARDSLLRGEVGTNVFHIGTESEKAFFRPDPESDRKHPPIRRVGFDEAEGIVCTGLFDDTTENPEDYRAMLADAARRRMKFLCANPDIVVDRGPNRVYCAGALARLFETLGGTALMFGKPRRRIYDLARRRLSPLLQDIAEPRILCIGDGLPTDIAGAENQSLDSIFVTGGLAAEETGTVRQPDPAKLDNLLLAAGFNPKFAIGHLR